VAVGRAIVRQPKAFLFDEPLSNLDAKLRVEMRAELKRLHHRLRTTTIYVTHDQEEAMTLGDRIVVMKDGEIQHCGTPLEVYDTPANRFVAGFVGTPPMNFLDGTLRADDDKLLFQAEGFRLELTPDIAEKLRDHQGRQVVLGVRPEGMSLQSQGRFAGSSNSIGTDVQVVEPLGEKMDLHLLTQGGTPMVARVDARRDVEAGQHLQLHLDMSKVHCFEPGQAGENLTIRPEAAVSG
jgi:multiple sugar transport system ATP-binding protein